MNFEPLRIAWALTSGFLLVAGVGGLGEVSLKESSPQAYFRVAFRFRPPLYSRCRTLSQEEQEKLPVHMRQKEICQRSFLPYHLKVTLAGRVVLDQPLVPRGIHHDRPLGVDELFPVLPGTYPVEVHLFPLEESQEGISLEYRQEISFPPRAIAVLTLEEDRHWVLKSEGGQQSPRENSGFTP